MSGAHLSSNYYAHHAFFLFQSFYSKVPRSTLLRVYEAYKLDFELFDYDFNEVLTLAGYEPLP